MRYAPAVSADYSSLVRSQPCPGPQGHSVICLSRTTFAQQIALTYISKGWAEGIEPPTLVCKSESDCLPHAMP